MRYTILCGLLLLASARPTFAQDEEGGKRFEGYTKASAEEFDKARPAIGQPFPELTVYTPDGKEFETASLRGHYTLVVLGCLTCPPFLGNVAGLEAVYRDYEPKGVKFYFVYRNVAHPELRGNYLQTFTFEERLAHSRQAVKQLGATIPWLVDPIDNRLKHALGNRANSEFLIDPKGIVVRKRVWSKPDAVRKDLEELVGKVDHITKPEDLDLKLQPTIPETAPRGFVERLPRAGMFPVVMDPQFDKGGQPFYAKLRAEADLTLLDTGKGKLYLGFHLDPFYEIHWNKLTKPLKFELKLSDGVSFSTTSGQAATVDADNDCDPREFMIDVEKWPQDKPVQVSVSYAVCSENECHLVKQVYLLTRERDRDGGRAAPAGFRGALSAEEMIKMMLAGDKNRDGKLAKEELPTLLRNGFDKSDRNGDGVLDEQELRALAASHVSFLPLER
jgi:hypothetical protein